MASIFLSHSHQDKGIARRLAHDLRGAGVTVWLDEAELDIGDSLTGKIARAIDTTDFLGVLLSSNSVRSEWVLREVEIALTREFAGRSVTVLPLLVEDCVIPPFLRGKVYADFRDESGYEHQLSRLLTRLGVNQISDSRTTTIVFDESYRQDEWFAQPVVNPGYSTVAKAVHQRLIVTSNTVGYANIDILSPYSILVFPMVFGSLVDDQEYAAIAKWVNRGGRLLLLGLYLMETHHYSNFNSLARRLGFEFRGNLTMPRGCEDFRKCMDQAFSWTNRNYWIETQLDGEPTDHPLLEGVEKIALTSSCTLDAASKPELSVLTAQEVAVMHARGHKNPEGRLTQLTDYVIDKYARAQMILALRYGAGRVVGIGSWKIFVNELVEADNDNLQLFQNTIEWLTMDDPSQRSGEETGS